MNELELKRSSLAMSGQMEMLTFYLSDGELYAINVFKIIEVMECPSKVIKMPHSHPAVKGTISFRDKSVAVIDLSESLQLAPVDYKNTISYIIVCEYYNMIHGFLINSPNVLINRGWDELHKPSAAMASTACLVALAYADDGKTIQLLDVEKIIAEVIGVDSELSDESADNIKKEAAGVNLKDYTLLLVDDSKSALIMLKSIVDKIGVSTVTMDSAVDALKFLEEMPDDAPATDKFAMIISDVEMPGMDGFTFTRKIKSNPKLSGLYIALHSSMSNESNTLKAKQVGADDFVPKFRPDELTTKILARIHSIAKSN
ncbi:MAG: chemotaxis protein [Candidatus Magnetominusculus sp. LBB02]|nr:chemotaxis protein [Candidatus Magnetominusculus sp. LBB02]